jgi:RNA recognition motif-containing protein
VKFNKFSKFKFGKLKEVRIVTYKNGKSKGLAYIDFEDEQSASKALIQTDGMLIGEQQIAVAISNPPKRDRNETQKDDGANKTSQISGLGSGSLSSRASSSSTPGSNVNLFLPRSQIMNTNRKKTINF